MRPVRNEPFAQRIDTTFDVGRLRSSLLGLNILFTLFCSLAVILDPRTSSLVNMLVPLVLVTQLAIHSLYVKQREKRERERRLEYDEADVRAYEQKVRQERRMLLQTEDERYACRVRKPDDVLVNDLEAFEDVETDSAYIGDDGELHYLKR
jgi:hypothetical protein